MSKEFWTKEDWEHHVKTNCHNPYSFATVYAASLMHHGLSIKGLGLSGFQGGTAEAIAKKISKLPKDPEFNIPQDET